MTPADIAELLTMCAAFDRRTIGRADALAWHQVLADLDYADARQAVADHYSSTREWIMPVDIRQRVKAIRERRITAAHPVYDGQPGETGAQSAAGIRALTADAASGRLPARPIALALEAGTGRPSPRLLARLPEVGRDIPAAEQPHIGVNALAVACPHCHVPAGQLCKSRRQPRRRDVHPSRLDAAHTARASA